MTVYVVELEGVAREVYLVEADSPEAARESWADAGVLQVSEASSMEVYSVREQTVEVPFS